MKNLLIAAILSTIAWLANPGSLHAQTGADAKIDRWHLYGLWIQDSSLKRTKAGYLFGTEDYFLLATKTPNAGANMPITMYPVENILNVQIHGRYKIVGSMGVGAGIGILTALVLGLSDSGFAQDAPKFPKTLVNIVILTPIGLGIGAAIGSAKITIPINGNLDNYKAQRQKLRKYTMRRE